MRRLSELEARSLRLLSSRPVCQMESRPIKTINALRRLGLAEVTGKSMDSQKRWVLTIEITPAGRAALKGGSDI